MSKIKGVWYLYLIECQDGSIYTGITTDINRRYEEHQSGKGAHYTRTHPPKKVLATFLYPDRASATRAEYHIKKLSSTKKRQLTANNPLSMLKRLHADKSTAQCRDWDIFCHVVDNFGDIGVCWRLARLLAHTYQQEVRLWVDNLAAFSALCKTVDLQKTYQQIENISIYRWDKSAIETIPAEIVVSAFGCQLPEYYLSAMAEKTPRPIWINLEYLSAETWIESYHGLSSPHPYLPLTQYFFFPGFTEKVGGLLYEPKAIQKRIDFQQDPSQQQQFWLSIGLTTPIPNERRISLFCYDNPRLMDLFTALQQSQCITTCLVPQGPAEKYVAAFFGISEVRPHTLYQQGNVRTYVLPFLEQDQYDQLLWACHINFVRGEDSFIRAQLAARPFIWHIYPQEDGAHWPKLDAFLHLYAADFPTLYSLWHAWNGSAHALNDNWYAYEAQEEIIHQHAKSWTTYLTQQKDLAAKLILFCENKLE